MPAFSHNERDGELPGQPAPGRRERRRTRRYPLKLEVAYRTASEGGGFTGSGETRDISSRALLFTADSELAAGANLQVTLRWPVELGGATPIRLLASGPILRRDSRGIVLLIKRYAFIHAAGPVESATPGEDDESWSDPSGSVQAV
jgi:hypothetical protein